MERSLRKHSSQRTGLMAERSLQGPVLDRRQLLTCAIGGALHVLAPGTSARAQPVKREVWVSAHGEARDSYGLAWMGPGSSRVAGNTLTRFRGHAVVKHAKKRDSVLYLSRRPGTEGIEVDLRTGEVVRRFQCLPGRHLFGHACFSADGDVLFTTENDVRTGLGKIVARESSSYSILDEWPSYGIGPHEIRLLPDGKNLVVANGGILTHPESGRKRLNLDSMRSSLSYVDAANGTLVGEFFPAEPKASIRHIDVTQSGSVVFAIQMQRDAAGHDNTVPLAGVHRPGESLSYFSDPKRVIDKLNDYTGSVAVSDNGIAGFASPRGNLVVFWRESDGRFLGYHKLRDVCGIAVRPFGRGFVISNSFGELRELDAETLQERRDCRVSLPGRRWDNHLLVTRAA